MQENIKLMTIEDFEPHIGGRSVERILNKAKKLRDTHVVHVNSTYYGGGVAEMLSSLTLLFNNVGIKTGWRAIQGSPDFFSITKKIHNALQGGSINLTKRKKEIFEDVVRENAIRNHLDHDIVIINDPQPLPMIRHYRKRGPWIWRCHVDLTRPHAKLFKYLKDFIEEYDASVFTLKEYRQKLKTPQLFFLPAINPFSIKNQKLKKEEINERLQYYNIPTDLPLVVQISRFDKWKDPEGVIKAFRIARKKVDFTLVLLGNIATDDPEGTEVYQKLLDCQEERIIILSRQDSALVNALQSRADVVIQKSLREGFGLTVTEAMWKGTPVIGGNVGGIRYQIKDGENGYLVSSIEETAEKIVYLLKNNDLRKKMGMRAKKTVEKKFLMSRLIEEYLDLCNSFKTDFKLVRK